MAGGGRVPAAWIALAAAIALSDQATKAVVLHAFEPGESLYVTGFFNLVLAFNDGAAFSFLAGAGGWQRWFFVGIALVASVVILVLLFRHRDERVFSVGLSLILGGAVGNVWDRLAHGHVVDFIQLHAMGWYWPAFNLADSSITVGAGLLILDGFRPRPAPPAGGQGAVGKLE
jgi:signal peptidase II